MTIPNGATSRLLARKVSLMLFALVGASAHAACSIAPLDNWATARAVWDGACKNGQAHGLGVLKEFTVEKKSFSRFLFGRAHNGAIVLGVIDQTDGYVAGSFKDGKVIASDERQATISAFKEASTAAEYVASRYRKSGNTASAKFYDGKAKQLAEQID